MATPDSFDLQRERTKRLQATGEVPMPAAGAPTTPAAQPRRQFSSSIGGKIGQAVYDTPGEVRSGVRDLIRNPIDSVAAATAPLLGAGSGVRALGAGTNALRTAAGLPGAAGAVPAVRAAVPSLRQGIGVGAGLTGAGTVLAYADQEQSRPGSTAKGDIQTLPAVEAKLAKPKNLYDNERLAERYGADAIAPQGIRRMGVEAEDAPANATMRSRTQGAVIANPHAMSAEDQLYFAAKRFKGSPSMRQAAAGIIAGREQNDFAARQAELNANDATNAVIMKGENEARGLFADRKLKSQMFNANLDEEARQADQSAQVDREGHLLGAGSRGIRRMGDGDAFSDQIFKAALKDYGPEGAARLAATMGNLSGEVGENPYDRYAQSADMIGTSEGIRRYNDRWLGFGNKDFDVTTAKPESTAGGIRGALTPGVRAGDVRYVDAKGNRQWGDAASLPQGQSVESFSLQREMQRRRREAAGME